MVKCPMPNQGSSGEKHSKGIDKYGKICGWVSHKSYKTKLKRPYKK
jgi:hypothetical protein